MEAKYKKIEKKFIDGINSGKFKVGSQLPPETKIAEKTGYSRMTINKAFKNLEEKGYITRISGRGSFVKAKNILRMINDNASFSEVIRNQGMEPSSTLLSYELVNSNSDAFLKDKLDVNDKTNVHHFIRLRMSNDTPVAISDDYLIEEMIKNIDLNLINTSLYAYLKRLKLPVLQNYVEIEAVKATEEQQQLLELTDDFLLKTIANVDTITNDNQQKRLGLFCTYYNPKLYTYRFNTDR